MRMTALDRLSDMEFCAIIAQSTSINDARKRIGGKNSQQTQDRIRERIQRLQIDLSHFYARNGRPFLDDDCPKHGKCEFRDYNVKGVMRRRCLLCKREHARSQREANRERERQRNVVYRETHRDQTKAYGKRYTKEHPAENAEKEHKRRARKREASVVEDIDRTLVFVRDKGKCQECEIDVDILDWHMDHIIPLGPGNHTYDNVRVTCEPCNLKKIGRDKRILAQWREGGSNK